MIESDLLVESAVMGRCTKLRSDTARGKLAALRPPCLVDVISRLLRLQPEGIAARGVSPMQGVCFAIHAVRSLRTRTSQ